MAAETTIRTTVGYGGTVHAGRSVPVWVEVAVDRLAQGTVEVTARASNGGPDRAVVRVPVEVPGGSAKSVFVAVPAMQNWGGALEVSARLLDDDGKAVVTSPVQQVSFSSDQEIVGLLPGAAEQHAAPVAARLLVDAGTARFAPLGPAELAEAPGSLDSIGSIIAAGRDVANMVPSDRAGLLHWVDRGGQLLVTSPAGATIEGLPEAWQPGPSGFADAGLGRVRLIGSALAEGRWDSLIEPTVVGQQAGAGLSDGSFAFGGPVRSVGDSLAVDAGLRVPLIGPLIGFLLAYVLVVGPITAIVLNKRGRSELAWVVIPLVALLFTGGSYLGARVLRHGTELAHATVIESSDAGAAATTYAGVAARGAAEPELEFDRAWSAAASPTSAMASMRGQAGDASVVITPRGPAAHLSLRAGEFGVAKGLGPSSTTGGLVVSAKAEAGDRLTGTVRNTTEHDLDEVAVFLGWGGVLVGQLDAGAERSWTMTSPALQQGQPPEQLVWPRAFGRFGEPDEDTVVNLPLWQEHVGLSGAGRPRGMAVAAGWTRDVDPRLTVDGRRRGAVGRTVVTGRAAVSSDGWVREPSVRVEYLRGGDANAFRGGGGGGRSSVLRFTLPAGTDADAPLEIAVPVGTVAEVWNGAQWVRAAALGGSRSAAAVGPGASDIRSLTPASLHQGRVYVRTTGGAAIVRPGGLTGISVRGTVP